MSIGGGSQKQKSASQQTSEGVQYGTDVWGVQSPYLQQLYQSGLQTYQNNGGDNGAMTWAGGAANSITGANAALDRSNQALGTFLDPGQDPAVAAYAQNLGQQFNEQFLPGLQGDAALAGGLGGSRQGIGAALGAQRAMQTLGDFTAQTYAGQQERALQAAQGIGANASGYQNSAQLQGTLADFARSMPFYQLQQFAGLLGSPVMRDLGGRTSSSGTSKGSGSGWNANAGLGGG